MNSSFWGRAIERNQPLWVFSSIFLKSQDDSRRISNEEQMKRQELSTKFHNTIKVCHFFFLTSSRQSLRHSWSLAVLHNRCIYYVWSVFTSSLENDLSSKQVWIEFESMSLTSLSRRK
jgi:hypothetical protein